jgi:hypothetical protein
MNWFELIGIAVWMAIVVLMIIGADESETKENT